MTVHYHNRRCGCGVTQCVASSSKSRLNRLADADAKSGGYSCKRCDPEFGVRLRKNLSSYFSPLVKMMASKTGCVAAMHDESGRLEFRYSDGTRDYGVPMPPKSSVLEACSLCGESTSSTSLPVIHKEGCRLK